MHSKGVYSLSHLLRPRVLLSDINFFKHEGNLHHFEVLLDYLKVNDTYIVFLSKYFCLLL